MKYNPSLSLPCPKLLLQKNKFYIPSILFFFLCFSFLPNVGIAANTNPQYTQELIQQARAKKLWNDPYWHLLVRYQSNLISGFTSYITTPSFFLAKDGKINPQAELEATIQAFFAEAKKIRLKDDISADAQCRFPARLHWLTKQLNINTKKLPINDCHILHKWEEAIAPKSVSIIFPGYDVSRPGSMFGHISLRFNAKNTHNTLLNFAITYSAAVDQSKELPFLLAIEGLFGGYNGAFQIMPYYKIIQEYTDMDLRDVWEYELRLNKEELQRLLWAIWEVRTSTSDYYFTSRNCASAILMILDTANENWHLHANKGLWRTPKEATRIILKNFPEAIVTYKPSRYSLLRNKLHYMNSTEKDWFYKQFKDNNIRESQEFNQLPKTSKARIFDAQIDAYMLQQKQKVLPKKRMLQRKRASLGVILPEEKQIQYSTDPSIGHDSQKISLGFGKDSYKENFISLFYRPAFHDLLEDPTGFSKISQLTFFGAYLRIQSKARPAIRLQKLNIVDASKLRPYDTIIPSIIWDLNLKLQTDISLAKKRLAPQAQGAVGYSYMTGNILWAALLQGRGSYNCLYKYCHQIGAGAKFQALYRSTYMSLLINTQNGYYFLGDKKAYHQIDLGVAMFISSFSEVRFTYTRYNKKQEFIGRWGFYF